MFCNNTPQKPEAEREIDLANQAIRTTKSTKDLRPHIPSQQEEEVDPIWCTHGQEVGVPAIQASTTLEAGHPSTRAPGAQEPPDSRKLSF